MRRRTQCARLGVAVLVAIRFAIGPAAGAAVPWSLVLFGQDITSSAALRENTGVLEVNVTALASMLNLRISRAGTAIVFTSASGRRANGVAGEFALATDTGILQLAGPIRVEGAAVFVPVEAISRIAEVEVLVDRANRIVRLNRPGTRGPGGGAAPGRRVEPETTAPLVSAPEGWQGFSVEKSDEEKRETARLDARPESDEAKNARARATGVLRDPEPTDALHITAEPSYVYGSDGAMPLTGFGKLAGYDTDFTALPTFGPLGVRFLSGQINFGDRAAGWNITGGDLFSEIWGLARGVRFSDQISKSNLASVGLYLQTRHDGTDTPVVSLADQYTVTRNIAVAGEVDSDASYFGRATLHTSRFTGSAFYRDANMRDGKADGFSASLQALPQIGVSASYTSTGAGLDRIIMRNAGVRWNMFQRVNMTVMETRTSTGYYKMRADSALAAMNLSRVRLNLQYLRRDIEYLMTSVQPTAAPRTHNNQWITQASVRISARAFLDEQIVTQWAPGISTTSYDQFTATVVASKAVNLNLLASLIDPGNPARLRAMLQYKIRPTASLIFEYGNIPSYQNVPPAMNPQSPDTPIQQTRERGFRIAVRKDFNLDTPTRGGNVQGVVLDSNRSPVSGAVVEAGPYATLTDENGTFEFRKLPRGEYNVKLRETSVPAELYGTAETVSFESSPGRSVEMMFNMVNLREIHGSVFLDANGNGRPDDGEGVEMVTLRLGDEKTSSLRDGRFGFYNLKPGTYTVTLVAGSLPKGLILASAAEASVEVSTTGDIPEILFRLLKKPEDIRFIEPLQQPANLATGSSFMPPAVQGRSDS
jgi:hypothetical protein